MNDDLMLEYLLQMGAMAPGEEKLLRQQAQVDALRARSMDGPTGQMVGKHYVPPSFTQYGAQIGNAFMAGRGQKKLNKDYEEFNKTQIDEIEKLRNRRAQRQAMATGVTPASMVPVNANYGVKQAYNPNEDDIFYTSRF